MLSLEGLVPDKIQTTLVFFVNGKKVTEDHPDPECTLLWYLRNRLQLTGTKYGCGEGGCGACTVMLSKYIRTEDVVKHVAVNACLTPLCAMHGLAVTTVEGIGSTESKLHPVQERIAKAHGSQCGFCTPGIVMSMYALLRNSSKIQYDDIETALQGNLCRCTGYRPIIEGFKTFMEGWEKLYTSGDNGSPCMMGKDCCRNKPEAVDNQLYIKSDFRPYDRSQEPIFPPELRLWKDHDESYLVFQNENVVWIRPNSLQELLALKSKIPESKIVMGNTEIGVEMKFKKKTYPVLLSPSSIADMNFCKVTDEGIVVGGTTTLTDLLSFLKEEIHKDSCKSKTFECIKEMLHWFAGTQVRNVASLVGNIVTASPISDLNPILMASSAKLKVSSFKRGIREIIINENFFKGYRITAIEKDEVVLSVVIPFTEKKQFVKAYKQARRRDDDISIVTAAFNVKLNDANVVSEAKLCFGGMGPTTKCALKSSRQLVGRNWDQSLLRATFDCLTEELELDISVPGGMADYRKSLCLSLFFRFYLHVLQQIQTNGYKIENGFNSGVDEIIFKEPTGSQYFEIVNKDRHITDAVGIPIHHASALKQATGEAVYCDDIPHLEGELYLTLVFSSEPHAEIKSIDASKALDTPGVVAFLSATDLEEECNKMGPIFKDEDIFAKKVVTSRACVIGAVVATTEKAARRAKDLVVVDYEKLTPVIVSLEDAIEHKSYYSGYPKKLVKGDVKTAFESSSHIAKGKIRSGAQEHFYLETISAYAVRKEDELEVVSTSQNPSEVAHLIAEALRLPNHKVIAKVKRIGGGFGGKETRASLLAVPVAIAAYKLKKPVRAVLDRDEDMQVTGYRHPCLIEYEVAFNNDGKIQGAKFQVYSNAGNSMDISCSMMERAIAHVDNCYYIPAVEIDGYVCRTNMPSNTAFRGFGAPKAMLAAEAMIRSISDSLGKTYEEIAEINLYKEGSLTHYNQVLTYCTLSRCWSDCIETSNYWERKKGVEEFNSQNRWKKKGIALVPTKYGISFQVDILMQAGALLLIYNDGSVLLSIGGIEMGQGLFTKMIQVASKALAVDYQRIHISEMSTDKLADPGALLLIYNDGSVLLSIGGIEMGQGLFTKMIQVASKALAVDYQRIHISEMSTDKVPNSSPTAGSISSDLCGMAVIDACDKLTARLAPYREKQPDGRWEDWVFAAYADRTSLFATGFYAAPKITYDPATNSGNLFEYFTYGVACSEVIVDCLTGDHQVLRTDIVMDVGSSLNPAIDIGQIEGAFMQGYGFYTIEEMVFSARGEALSRGPGAYKIPAFSDIPKVFNVSLLKGAPNPRAVYSSKAVGEPPLFLASSIYFAIKEAIKSARRDSGVPEQFELNVPATCERIRMACEDDITKQVKPTISGNGQPWNVIA